MRKSSSCDSTYASNMELSFGKEVLFLYHRVTIASKFKIENIFIEKLNVFDLFLRSSSENMLFSLMILYYDVIFSDNIML